jgi:hypothetical protein
MDAYLADSYNKNNNLKSLAHVLLCFESILENKDAFIQKEKSNEV